MSWQDKDKHGVYSSIPRPVWRFLIRRILVPMTNLLPTCFASGGLPSIIQSGCSFKPTPSGRRRATTHSFPLITRRQFPCVLSPSFSGLSPQPLFHIEFLPSRRGPTQNGPFRLKIHPSLHRLFLSRFSQNRRIARERRYTKERRISSISQKQADRNKPTGEDFATTAKKRRKKVPRT